MEAPPRNPHRDYSPKHPPSVRALLRLVAYLLLADGAWVPHERLVALLKQTSAGRKVRLATAIDQLRAVGCDIQLGVYGVRLVQIPPDDLLEPVLQAVDDLKLVGRVPALPPSSLYLEPLVAPPVDSTGSTRRPAHGHRGARTTPTASQRRHALTTA